MIKSEKPVYVLGTGLSHDGSACLLKDGRIRVAIEKERLTRRKHDGGITRKLQHPRFLPQLIITR